MNEYMQLLNKLPSLFAATSPSTLVPIPIPWSSSWFVDREIENEFRGFLFQKLRIFLVGANSQNNQEITYYTK